MNKIPPLILDDFGLIPMPQNDQPLLLELIQDRHQRGSLIVTSQLPIKLWHGQFSDPTLADAILDPAGAQHRKSRTQRRIHA